MTRINNKLIYKSILHPILLSDFD